jgi:hypothetical protein
MKKLSISAVLVAVPLLMAARPGTEQQLIQQLNGQPIRVIQADGGAWGIFTQFDGGTANNRACAPLTGLRNNVGATVSANVIMFVPLVPVNVCMAPSINSPLWDGGCNTLPQDMNYGWPLPVNVPQYMTPDGVATAICAVTDAGYLSVPLGWAQ